MRDLYVKQLQLGPMENFVYLVGALDSRETAIIDAAWDIDVALAAAAADGRQITHALVSHWHADHTNGLVPLLEKQGVSINCHKADIADLPQEVRGEVHGVEGGELIQVGPLGIRALHTPGHTPGSTTWHVEASAAGASDEPGAIFSGDTLFVNACGRCDLRGGDPALMFESLRRLSALGDGVTLYPGHDYGGVPVSSIAREKEKNPYFSRLGMLEQFVALRMRPRA